MGKCFTLLLLIALTSASLYGYLYLNNEIKNGEKKLAAGQKELEKGQKMLKAGKARLADGKKQLAHGKQKYHTAKAIPLGLFAHVLPEATPVFNKMQSDIAEGGRKIAQGEQQIAAGEKKIKWGEAQVAAGKKQWMAGKEKLAQAKQIRFILEICTGSFGFLTFIFIIYWIVRRKT